MDAPGHLVHPQLHHRDERRRGLQVGGEAEAGHVDLGKMQMFFFTLVLILIYCSEIGHLLDGDTAITEFPPISDGMNELLEAFEEAKEK